MNAHKYLTAEQFQQFSDEGFLVVDAFLDSEELQAVRRDIKEVCEARADMTRDDEGFNLEKIEGETSTDHRASAKQAGLFRKIQGAVFHVPALKDVFTSDKMLDCMQDLMGSDIYYHSSKVMFKPAGGSAKPWHQDAAYWKDYLPNQITIWIAIDDATVENGCVWAIPGSHKLGHIPHARQELQVEESRIDLGRASPVPVMSGGLLIFHSLVLHMSHKNESDKPRCAIICDYDPEPNPAVDRPQNSAENGGAVTGLDENGVWPLRVSTEPAGL
jgi:ectoine hydroxylase-related dioxygenase (phytanoyl-CoA dioxygenase family)